MRLVAPKEKKSKVMKMEKCTEHKNRKRLTRAED